LHTPTYTTEYTVNYRRKRYKIQINSDQIYDNDNDNVYKFTLFGETYDDLMVT
jgi:hypothetical protein